MNHPFSNRLLSVKGNLSIIKALAGKASPSCRQFYAFCCARLLKFCTPTHSVFLMKLALDFCMTWLGCLTSLSLSLFPPQAPIQRLADRIAAVFVPTIVSLALITFTSWAIVVGVASHDPQVRVT